MNIGFINPDELLWCDETDPIGVQFNNQQSWLLSQIGLYQGELITIALSLQSAISAAISLGLDPEALQNQSMKELEKIAKEMEAHGGLLGSGSTDPVNPSNSGDIFGQMV